MTLRARRRHRWRLRYDEAAALQRDLGRSVRLRPLPLRRIRWIAGCDVAISKSLDLLVASVVVFSYPRLEQIESRVASATPVFPYIPGLLSFREIPVLMACLRRVRAPVDVIICDGQGIAHPRRFGLASHLGVLLERPTVGCAKSRLVGEHREVPPERGAFTPLTFEGRRVGSVVRTQDGVKPLFVSPGHLVDHASARRLVVACASQYRLPQPVRAADRLAGEEKRRREARSVKR